MAQAQTDIQALQRQISSELSPKLKAAVAEVVKATAVQVVLNADTSVVWAVPGLDLTPKVIEHLNAGVNGTASRSGAVTRYRYE